MRAQRSRGRKTWFSQGAYLLDLGEGTLVAGKQYGSHDCGVVVYWVVGRALRDHLKSSSSICQIRKAEQRTQNDTNLVLPTAALEDIPDHHTY